MDLLCLTPEELALAPYCRPEVEAAQYHDKQRDGFFAIGWSTRAGRDTARHAFQRRDAGEQVHPSELTAYRQRSFRLREMHRVLTNVSHHIGVTDEPGNDYWISQAEFSKPNRQKINLARIAVAWVDLDLQHDTSPPHLRRLGKDKALQLALTICSSSGIPQPSLVLWTGRGLVLKWYTDSLPKQAYPRWAAVQKVLVEAFRSLGADAAARDASRILRIAGTRNSKSGQLCEPIFGNFFFGDIQRVAFDDLADAVLPITRETLEKLRRDRDKADEMRRLRQHFRALQPEKSGNLTPFNPIRLAWLQVDDYRKLAGMRPVAERPEGWTNTIVWLAASALAVAVWADEDRWGDELLGLARELAPHWPSSRIAQATSSIGSRMAAMARGEWVEQEGRRRPPVFTPSHRYIIDTLGVTDRESEQLTVIIPKDLARDRARQRDRERHEKRRRDAGALPRRQWLESQEQRRANGRLLRAAGKTWREVAEACGYSSTDAARMACG